MRGVRRHCFKGLRHNIGNLVVPDLAWRATTRFVIETIQALGSKPLAPRQNSHPGGPDLVGDGAIIQTVSRQKNNLGAHRIRPRDLATPHPRFQLAPLPLAENDFYRSRPGHRSLRIIPAAAMESRTAINA